MVSSWMDIGRGMCESFLSFRLPLTIFDYMFAEVG